MYRLRVIPIFLPPLRERRGDVALLVEKVVEELNAKGRRRVDRVSPAALEVLEGYDFPGNVRELRNLMIYAFAIGSGPVLVPSDLPREVFHDNEDLERDAVERSLAPEAETAPRSPEAQRIVDVLSRTGGSRERAAKVLGWSRVTLWRRMRELGLVKS
jgi:DNA-binding NtrC family response regulator